MIIILAVIRHKKKNVQTEDIPPMQTPSADMLNLVEEAKKEAAEEIKAEREKTALQNPPEGEITPDMLEELLNGNFSDMTFSDSENTVTNPMPKKAIIPDEFVKIVSKPEEPAVYDEVPGDIKAYMSNNFALKGQALSDGDKNSADITIIGQNARLSADFDGKDVGILLLDGKMFIINNEKNTYIELTDSFLKLIGKNKNDIVPKNIGVSDKFSSIKPKVYGALIDEKDAVCFEYTSEEKTVKLYTVNGKCKLIVTEDSNGKPDTIIKIDSFTPEPDTSRISTDSLKKVGALSFFKDLI